MIALVGLGNLGDKYAQNRHNTGFMFVDFVVKSQLVEFQYIKKCDIYSAELTLCEQRILCVKPAGFMNTVGKPVSSLLHYFKLKTTDLIIVHDDLDLTLGQYKIQQGRGPKKHNGVLSIETALKTTDFKRIRVGIDNRSSQYKVPGEKYVLDNFLPAEEDVIRDLFPVILQDFCKHVAFL